MFNLRALACLLLIPLAVSCQADRYSMKSSLAPQQGSEVIVLGNHPRIQLVNGGPGLLSIQFRDGQDGEETIELNAASTSTRTLPGPVTVMLRAGGQSCSYKITAFDCQGLRADLLLESPEQ